MTEDAVPSRQSRVIRSLFLFYVISPTAFMFLLKNTLEDYSVSLIKSIGGRLPFFDASLGFISRDGSDNVGYVLAFSISISLTFSYLLSATCFVASFASKSIALECLMIESRFRMACNGKTIFFAPASVAIWAGLLLFLATGWHAQSNFRALHVYSNATALRTPLIILGITVYGMALQLAVALVIGMFRRRRVERSA